MTYNEYLKKLAKGPLVLTANILLSIIVLIHFIFLFLGRWVDLVEFGANVLLLVTMWMMFAKASSKQEKSMSGVRTCVFVFAIVKLISLCIAVVGIIITSIYAMTNSTQYFYDTEHHYGSMIAGGLILLLLGGGIYIVRIIITVFFLSETGKIRKEPKKYILKRNWKGWFIVCASLRGGSLLVQWIFTMTSIVGFAGILYYDDDWLAYIIRFATVPGIYGVTLLDLLYIAFFIILVVVMGKYFKTVREN